MKLFSVIKKDIMLLLRSRISSFVLILGPLLIIILVGFSFSTSSFNLKIGVYSDSYSELSESLIETLKEDNYAVSKYSTEEMCIEEIKEGKTHACIIFPPGMSITNEYKEVVRLYVDQSKINLAYLVMSTLTSSFGEKSTEISKDLTNKIVDSLFYAKNTLIKLENPLSDAKKRNIEITEDTEASIEGLEKLDLSSTDVSLDARTNKIQSEIDTLLLESTKLIKNSMNLVESLDEWTQGNGTAYLEELESELQELNVTLYTKHNETKNEIILLTEELNQTITEITEKLDNAREVNFEVLDKTKKVKENIIIVKENTEEIDNKVAEILNNINSVEITNVENIASPIITEINPIVKSQTNLGFLFPSLIVMLIMFIGLLLPSSLIIMEKKSKSFFRVFTTPTKNRLYVLSTFITSMLIIFFQVMIILFVSQLYFKINLLSSFFILFISLIMIMSLFVIMGMFIGYVFNSEEIAMMAAVSIGSLLLLTSGIVFPLESMPNYILDKAKMNPMLLGSEMFKKSLLFGANFESIKQSFMYLAIFFLTFLFFILLIKKHKRIIYLIKKPFQVRQKKEKLMQLFDFADRKAKTLPEFIISLHSMTNEKFTELLNKSAFYEWMLYVEKNKVLAGKIKNISSKEELNNFLIEEIKKQTKNK